VTVRDFIDHQIDKILLAVLLCLAMYSMIIMVHWNFAERYVQVGIDAFLIILGALMREIAGPISELVKSLNGKNGGTNATVEKN